MTQYTKSLEGRWGGTSKRFAANEDGQDLIEYALLAALISIVAIGIIVLVGPYLVDTFQFIVNGLSSA